ncbi:MAG: hypothetical protein R3C44_17630 [Chloroflexota bacterium]
MGPDIHHIGITTPSDKARTVPIIRSLSSRASTTTALFSNDLVHLLRRAVVMEAVGRQVIDQFSPIYFGN